MVHGLWSMKCLPAQSYLLLGTFPLWKEIAPLLHSLIDIIDCFITQKPINLLIWELLFVLFQVRRLSKVPETCRLKVFEYKCWRHFDRHTQYAFSFIHFSWTCFWFIDVYIHFTYRYIRITLVFLAIREACMYSLPHIQVLAFHSKLLHHKEFASIQCSLPVVQKKPSKQYQNILTNCCRKYAFN